MLDAAFSRNPVAVIHVAMHGAVPNSAAFAKFDYTDGMPTPAGGAMLRKEGSLAPGARADPTVLSDNPLTVDPMTIRDIKVERTIKDGKTIYSAE